MSPCCVANIPDTPHPTHPCGAAHAPGTGRTGTTLPTEYLPSSGGIALPSITASELAELPPAELLARSQSMIIRELSLARAAPGDVIGGLDTVRVSIFGYWVLHIHGRRALTGFCAELPHRTVDPDFWKLLQRSLAEIGDDAMLAVVRELHAEISRACDALVGSGTGRPEHGWDARSTAAMHRLLDRRVMQRLDEDYRRADAGSLDVVAAYIRRHAGEVFAVDGEAAQAR